MFFISRSSIEFENLQTPCLEKKSSRTICIFFLLVIQNFNQKKFKYTIMLKRWNFTFSSSYRKLTKVWSYEMNLHTKTLVQCMKKKQLPFTICILQSLILEQSFLVVRDSQLLPGLKKGTYYKQMCTMNLVH